MKNNKIETWKLVMGAISIIYIISMWVKKDMLSTNMPLSLPLIVTSIAVTLLKVCAIASVVLLVKWLMNKLKKE